MSDRGDIFSLGVRPSSFVGLFVGASVATGMFTVGACSSDPPVDADASITVDGSISGGDSGKDGSAPQKDATTDGSVIVDGTTPDVVTQPDGTVVPDGAATKTTIFTVLFENHDYKEIVGSSNAPYFNELIAKYGLATNYNDCNIHPSLPNYLCMISGDPQYIGIIDLDPTQSFITGSFPVDKENLGSQLQKAGIPWGAYQESMGTPCKLSGSGNYAPKHDPFLYFKDIQKGAKSLCDKTNIDYGGFAADLAADKNRYYFITPNLVSDGHDPANDPVAALKASDTWARAEIDKIMKSAAYKNGGVIFITWDEAEGRNGNSKEQVPMIVVSERIKSTGFQSAKAYTHKSYLATVEDLLGLPRLATVTTEATMTEFLK